MRKNFLYRGMMLLASALTIASCTNEAEEMSPQGSQALDVQVAVNPTSRAQVIGTSLPEGAKIGVNVTAADGSEYDGQNAGYLNVAYTATGTGGTQTWGSTAPVMLSGTEGKLYAYYPHTADVDYKAIEVNIADQHDWMVGAEAYNVSDKAPSVAITMNHVQTALNINVVRDAAYTGDGLVEALAITSEGLASEGTLDTRDGSWSAINGANTAISIISAPFTLDGSTLTNQENPYMFVPASAETKDFTVSATVDGKVYNVGVAMNEAFAKGKVYKLNVNITNTGLTVSQVTLTDWVIDTTLPDAEFEPYDPLAKYADWVKLTYNVTVNSSATQIISEYADIASVAEMAILENDGSRAAGEPVVVTPTKTYQFSTTGTHTVYVKFADMTKVPDAAFMACTGLTGVTIPNSVQTIGEAAFASCRGLTEVTIPNSVQTIEDGAFSGCMELTEVFIPNSVTEIGISAFSGCSGLTEVTIGSNVTTIGESAFNNCTGLTEVTIPNSVQTIGRHAFRMCTGLISVTIGSGVQTIGDWAFESCEGLTSITSLAIIAPSLKGPTFYEVETGGILYVSAGATGYEQWMKNTSDYLGYYNWTMQEITGE